MAIKEAQKIRSFLYEDGGVRVKYNRVVNGFKTVFSIIGLLVCLGSGFIIITNAYGVGSMLSVIALVKAEALHQPGNGQIVEGATAGIVASLKDPYSKYLDSSEWQELCVQIKAQFGGIGVYVVENKDGKLGIVSPIKGTPAERAGLKGGDVIIGINDKSALHMTSDEAAQLLRGDKGTKVKVSVYRPGDGKEYSFGIVRDIINVPSVEDNVLTEDADIGYIKLNQFTSHSDQEIADSLNNLEKKKVKGLILDLRDNGGGDFDVARAIADRFLDSAEIVSVKDGRGKETVYKAAEGSCKVPMIVLVNGHSASASEVFSGALQDNGRAWLVGEKTFGKGVVQTVYPLRNGGALKLTTEQYFTPKGTDINKIGINPDYVVENPGQGGEDLQLRRALELLQHHEQKGNVRTKG